MTPDAGSWVFAPDVLSGKRALITGGGTGLGFGIATALARAGAAVALASRNPEHLRPAAEQLAQVGTKVTTAIMNVRDSDSVKSGMEQVADTLGGIDILVNNAAGNFYAPSATLSPRGWRAVIETDLDGTFFCSQAAYPFLAESPSGRIISISMTLHYRGWPQMAHATAAKAGVDALTRTLALEWARDGITVNAIAPGPILTEGVRRAFEKPTGDPDTGAIPINERTATDVPLGIAGDPSDIGHLAVYLASPAARWITGAIVVVDGGSNLARF